MARWAGDEGKAPTGLARLGVLYPLEKWIPDKIFNISTTLCIPRVLHLVLFFVAKHKAHVWRDSVSKKLNLI